MTPTNAYARAGVDIAAGNRATDLMADPVKATHGPEVLAGIGAFGGLFHAGRLTRQDEPVLVASTDGVGTKTMIAAAMNRWDTIGQDLVGHCINDIVAQGAEPLFFLDYVASSQLHPEKMATIVAGIARACRAAGCALLGGETAEMPGVYQPGEVDVVGTVIGVVDRECLVDGSCIAAGDVVLALPSNGLHTNGYTLARSALAGLDWNRPLPELGCSPGEALLAVHRCYAQQVRRLRSAGIEMKGIAHITGGGVLDNLPRILPNGVGVTLERGAWPEPVIFNLIQHRGEIPDAEMFHVFNMGLGMLVVVPAAQANLAKNTLGEDIFVVGEIVSDHTGVVITSLEQE